MSLQPVDFFPNVGPVNVKNNLLRQTVFAYFIARFQPLTELFFQFFLNLRRQLICNGVNSADHFFYIGNNRFQRFLYLSALFAPVCL